MVSSGSSGQVRGGRARNMKSMQPPLAAIFFMTYFHRAGGGGHGPLSPPPDPLLMVLVRRCRFSVHSAVTIFVDKQGKGPRQMTLTRMSAKTFHRKLFPTCNSRKYETLTIDKVIVRTVHVLLR